MSRFLVNDLTKTDHRALLNAEKMATLSDMVAPTAQYITASGAGAVTVVGDCIIAIAGGGVFKTEAAVLNASNLDVGTFMMGRDYYIYLCDTGSTNDEKYIISLNSTYPTGYSASNSRKIGGFHYGKNRKTNDRMQPVNASGIAFGAGWESTVFDGIVPRSVWTLAHRPKCSPEGMVYLGGGTWVDIYISSDNGAGGLKSAYGNTPMTGTEGMNWYSFNERAFAVGKRLLTYSEFCQMALGSPQGLAASNENAWTAASARTTTGNVAFAVSSIGCRDAVGDVWEWFNEFITRADHPVIVGDGTFAAHEGGRAGKPYTDGNGHGTALAPAWNWDKHSPFGDGYGNIYEYGDYSLCALLGGGDWSNGARAGSRSVNLNDYPWSVAVSIGVRCACDCL